MPFLPDVASLLTARSRSTGSDQLPAHASSSLDPLPQEVRNGMAAMGVAGIVSSISTLSLLGFITHRMVYWRRYYQHPLATNQIFVLIYNLLAADFQQALSFLLAFHWIAVDKLVGPSSLCFAQGWLIQIGDLSSGLWVLAIAVHTFINLVGQKQIPKTAFFAAVVAIWAFAITLTLIGPATYGMSFFVPAGAWCWIGEEHEKDRLTLHYVIRVSKSIKAQGSSQDSSTARSNDLAKLPKASTTTTVVGPSVDPFAVSRNRIMRTARYMVVYPLAYVALTLPLAVGRASAMAHKQPPILFFCVAGALMALSGIVDVALYVYTRKSLVKTSIGIKRNTQQAGNRLVNIQNPGSRSMFPGDGFGRMDGHTKLASDDGIAKDGVIMVSQSVTMSEESYETSGGVYAGAGRSESMKSLVKDDRGSDKS
ncbi:hypothetical protein LAWI1_G004902 [Lachnellula willkommii]|uniref:G protein-coupled receptor GPR1/2/3 C-terminal domain-containing protein n=1 Tax=Lachnellula willkommii TaxID=215461 RepID=A0A559MIZ8_9HELO|nr:hypothetical protein LAWI1_G004902 [Lachnellula willkommii]